MSQLQKEVESFCEPYVRDSCLAGATSPESPLLKKALELLERLHSELVEETKREGSLSLELWKLDIETQLCLNEIREVQEAMR